MIYHVTTATTNAFKLTQMAEWAQKVTAAIKESHGIEITVLRNVSGSGDEWHFMTTHDSLGDMETYINSVSSDPQFQALAGEAAEMELWRSTRTNIFRTV